MRNVVSVVAGHSRQDARKSGAKRSVNRFLLSLATAAVAPLFLAHPAAAQTWTGGSSNQFWDLASNWSTNAVPGAGADATNHTAFTVNYRQGTDTVNSYTSDDGGGFLMSGGILNLIHAFLTNGAYTQTGGTFTAGSFTTSSSFTMSAGTMTVGSFTQTGTGTLSLTGGTLNDTGNLTTSSSFLISGGTLQNATIVNSALLSFGNNSGNVFDNVTLAAGQGLTIADYNGSYRNDSYLRIADSFTFTPGVTFNVGASSNNNANSYLLFDSTAANPNPTLDNATVNLGYGAFIGYGNGFNGTGKTFTLGSNLVVQGAGNIGFANVYGTSTANLVNNGLIDANIANNGIGIQSGYGNPYNGTITNNGTVEATASGSTIGFSDATLVNNGTLKVTNGGYIGLNGNITNLGTLTVGTGGGYIVMQGATASGTLTGSNQSALSFGNNSGNVFDNVTLAAGQGLTIADYNGSYRNDSYLRIADSFTFTPGVTFNVGASSNNNANSYLLFDSTAANPNPTLDNATVNLGYGAFIGYGNGFNGTGKTFTLGSNLVVQGAGNIGFANVYGTSTANLVNNGLIDANIANNGIGIQSGYGNPYNGTITNNGTVEATASGSTIGFSDATLVNNGTLKVTNGGYIGLNGNITNLGTLTVGTGGGYIVMQGATASGTLTGSNQSALSFGNNSGNVFDNVTLAAGQGLTIADYNGSYRNDSYLRIADSFTFTPGVTFNVGASSNNNANSYLLFDSTAANPNPTLDNATVNLGYGAFIGYGNGFNGTGKTFTLGSNLVVQGAGNIGFANVYGTSTANLVNNGLIDANIANNGIGIQSGYGNPYNGTITNNGTVEATASGSTIGFSDATLVNNGTLKVTNGGYIGLNGNITNLGTLTVGTGGGYIVMQGATASGTLTGSNQSALSFGNNSGNVFDNVTLAAGQGLTIADYNGSYRNDSYLRIADSFTFTPGVTFNVGASSNNNANSYLLFDSTAANPNPTLDNATVNLGYGAFIGYGNGFNGTGKTFTLGSNLVVQGAGNIGFANVYGTSTANLVNNGLIDANIANNGIGIQSGYGNPYNGTITNNGTVEATASGSTIGFSDATLVNNGTLKVTNGGYIGLNGNITNLGTLTVGTGGGYIVMQGATASGTLTGSNQSALSFGNNSGNVFDNVTLAAGQGLTIADYNGSYRNDSYLRIADSFTFTPGVTFNVGASSNNNANSYLLFDSTAANPNPTLDNATVNLGYGAFIGYGNGFNGTGKTFTLGSNLVVQGAGNIGFANVYGTSTANLVNNGLIDANIANNGIGIQSGYGNPYNGTITNNGTVEATASGSTIGFSDATLVNNGTLKVTNGGYIGLNGNITNLGTLTVGTGGGYIVMQGATANGTLITNNQSALSFGNNTSNILDNVTLASGLGLNIMDYNASYANNAYLRIADSFTYTPGVTFNVGTSNANNSAAYLLFDSTTSNPNPVFDNATVNLGYSGNSGYLGYGNGFNGTGKTLTLGSNLVVQGLGTIGFDNVFSTSTSNLTNNGLVNANIINGGLSVNSGYGNPYNGTTTNNGIIEATASGSSIGFNDGTLVNNGTIAASGGGYVALTGNITNLGTLTIGTGGGYIAMQGATVNGVLTAGNQSALSYGNNTNNVFDNVTLASGLGLNILDYNGSYANSSYLRIADSFTFNSGATFNVGTSNANNSASYLLFDSTTANPNPTFDNATVNLGYSGNNGYIGYGNGFAGTGKTLTLGSNLVVQGAGGIGFTNVFGTSTANLVNNGLVNANIANNGISVNSGYGNPYDGTTTNNGTIEATASGSSLNIAAGTFVNTGTVRYNTGTSGTMTVTTATQTAGTTIENGALKIVNSSNAAATYTLQGGAMYGTGTITGNITNTGATFGAGTPGTSATTGTLTETGTFTQSGTGIFSAALGGTGQGTATGFDFFTVSGNAVLGGYLDISLINGFVPTSSETFRIISDTSQTGTFLNTPGNTIMDDSGKYLFSVVYGSNYVQLNGMGAVPEPGAGGLLLLGLVPGGGALVARRRLRK